MVSKEDFKKVWINSSKENILNQFYYEHNELFRIKKEVREYIENDMKLKDNFMIDEDGAKRLLEILDKEKE